MSAETHTEATLKALTVPKLKVSLLRPCFVPLTNAIFERYQDILTAWNLPHSGLKNDLIKSILDHQTEHQGGAPPEAVSAPPSPVKDDAPIPTKAPVAVTTGESSATSASAPAEAPNELTEEEKAKVLEEEKARRAQRAQRFGTGAGAVEGEDEAKNKARADKYGTGKPDVSDKVFYFLSSVRKVKIDEYNVKQSLAALDRPLGIKPERKGKGALSTPKADKPASAASAVVPAAVPAAKAVDPELAKKLSEEEEKKRKRAERFGEVRRYSSMPSCDVR